MESEVTPLDIKKELFRAGDSFAAEMVTAMERQAAADPEYAAQLDLWLGAGRSVLLRQLCAPFKTASFVKNLESTHPMPWFNCWDAIDSAWVRAG